MVPSSGPRGLVRASSKAPPPSTGARAGHTFLSTDHDDDRETIVQEDTRVEIPRRYKVIFHNDDYTTMEFVVECLMTFFHKSETEATHIMLTVHRKGSAVAGIYSREIAETKVDHVMEHARKYGMPLLLTAEPE